MKQMLVNIELNMYNRGNVQNNVTANVTIINTVDKQYSTDEYSHINLETCVDNLTEIVNRTRPTEVLVDTSHAGTLVYEKLDLNFFYSKDTKIIGMTRINQSSHIHKETRENGHKEKSPVFL